MEGGTTSIYIEENSIAEVGRKVEADVVLEGRDKACLPGLINAHTHAAMTLFRGFADDMDLQRWLQEKIWPHESKLTGEDVYWGTKLACLEMIKSGTTTFNDMYFFMEDAARAVSDMGLRAVLSYGIIDLFDEERGDKELKAAEGLLQFVERLHTPRITAAVGPHAIYTVSKPTLQAAKELALDHDVKVHMHLAETEREVARSREMYDASPVKALDKMGVLGPWLVAAHCVWVDETDSKLMAERGVAAVHNPTSNMKLAVGKSFPYDQLRGAGVTLALGTDGAASNNNLDMFEAMKLASLLQKFSGNDPTLLGSADAVRMGTEGGATALGIPAGRVEEGRLADLVLLDLKRPEMVPLFNLHANVTYSASGSAVDTVICDGKVLMKRGRVKGERKVLEKAGETARRVVSR